MTFLDDPNLTPPTLSLVFGAFFLGGLVKGMIGFGLPLIAVSVLAHFLPPPLVFGICVVPPFFLNILQVGSVAAAREVAARFWPVLLGIFAAVAAGAFVTVDLDKHLPILGIGIVVTAFSLLSLSGWKPEPRPKIAKAMGGVAGVVAGFTGVFSIVPGPPLVMYLVYAGVEPRVFKAALGFFFIYTSIVLTAAFSGVGYLTPATAAIGAMAIVPAGVAMWLGSKLSDRLDSDFFRKSISALLLAMGCSLVFQGL